jgi:hypothetical protein
MKVSNPTLVWLSKTKGHAFSNCYTVVAKQKQEEQKR